MNKSKKRHGFAPRPELRRTHVLKIRLRSDEKSLLLDRAKHQKMALASYAREAALNRLPMVIPEINREIWSKLAPISANLNQLVRHLNAGFMPETDEIQCLFRDFRKALIGGFPANSPQIDTDDESDLLLDDTSDVQENHQMVAGGNHERDE
ncbi:hypothetical protein [Halothiobacillus sp.]|uniref:plasmid mobilization protein n=1 Tax=Halothiobacillus sp. TaxID=1891311 RepID=UPI0026092C8E|nr:hypothetical protein [Halothiobacillus sp.]MDD4965997.1 hypothetical protein [Halothiobacillus sp.]